ncbi:hypothetical protein [Streptomyces sp.]|uniref:hypothetical protein n=1 Tax=Streptomyces sp. TaxID=1931 RepID=UPI002F931C30
MYALRLPEPHIQRKGESRPWDSLYSEMGHFTPETALFFAAARQDVEDLLAEVERLKAQVSLMGSYLQRESMAAIDKALAAREAGDHA